MVIVNCVLILFWRSLSPYCFFLNIRALANKFKLLHWLWKLLRYLSLRMLRLFVEGRGIDHIVKFDNVLKSYCLFMSLTWNYPRRLFFLFNVSNMLPARLTTVRTFRRNSFCSVREGSASLWVPIILNLDLVFVQFSNWPSFLIFSLLQTSLLRSVCITWRPSWNFGSSVSNCRIAASAYWLCLKGLCSFFI